MNNNSFEQIKNLLTQVSNYISKINEIIFQINNIINSQNQMNGMMMQMNMMNNMMNFQNNFNNDLNPLLKDQPLELDNKMINVVFDYKGKPIMIPAQEYLPLTEVINRFLQKIDKPGLIDNYQNQLKFYYNAKEFDNSKKVGEICQNKLFRIQVYDLQGNYY